MKTSAKTWLIIGVALILAGGLLLALAGARSHWDLAALGGGGAFEERTVAVNEAFENISVSSPEASVTFLPAENGKCSVALREQPKLKHAVAVKDGTLTVELEDSRGWSDRVSLFSSAPSITVYLPERAYAALRVEGDTGDVQIAALAFESVDISIHTGDVTCAASASGLMRISASTGDIRLENVSTGTLELSVSTGRVDVLGADCAGELKLHVSTGKAELTDVRCAGLTSDGSTGSLKLTNVIAAGSLTVERSTGDVKLDGCDAAELRLKTDTGDVSGSLLSEKIFITKSDTGDVRVPETVSGGVCRITTDTGDITITIQ